MRAGGQLHILSVEKQGLNSSLFLFEDFVKRKNKSQHGSYDKNAAYDRSLKNNSSLKENYTHIHIHI